MKQLIWDAETMVLRANQGFEGYVSLRLLNLRQGSERGGGLHPDIGERHERNCQGCRRLAERDGQLRSFLKVWEPHE